MVKSMKKHKIFSTSHDIKLFDFIWFCQVLTGHLSIVVLFWTWINDKSGEPRNREKMRAAAEPKRKIDVFIYLVVHLMRPNSLLGMRNTKQSRPNLWNEFISLSNCHALSPNRVWQSAKFILPIDFCVFLYDCMCMSAPLVACNCFLFHSLFFEESRHCGALWCMYIFHV